MKIKEICNRFKKHKIRNSIIATVGLALLAAVCDARLAVSYFNIENDKITSPVRFAVITDLHSCYYGKDQKTLINAIEKSNPDAVLLVGDIFDDVMSNKNTEIFIDKIGSKFPCFYVSGNHEARSGRAEEFKAYLSKKNVKVLTNEVDNIIIGGQKVQIVGVDDPSFGGFAYDIRLRETAEKTDFSQFSILLSHRPELTDEYNKYPFDLVVSGHAHGGQWRLPFGDIALLAPNQGLFPKYTSGLYDLGNTKIAVSRGLARESTLIPRVFNRPEILIITIK
jgi:predicted MPP superfamily phosphohydrolase